MDSTCSFKMLGLLDHSEIGLSFITGLGTRPGLRETYCGKAPGFGKHSQRLRRSLFRDPSLAKVFEPGRRRQSMKSVALAHIAFFFAVLPLAAGQAAGPQPASLPVTRATIASIKG